MSAPAIQVHIEKPSARASYVVRQVFATLLGWTVVLEEDADRFASAVGPKLVYGKKAVAGAFQVIPAGLLDEQGLRPMDPELLQLDGMPLLFPVNGGDLPFDPFSAAFYLLSRYEELVGVEQDVHGRPLADRLHGGRHGYLDRPVVDEWAILLARVWREKDADVPQPQRKYRVVHTVDLDNGFKYRGRPMWRSLGSMARDVIRGAWEDISQRLRVLRGAERDPFDVLPELKDELVKGAQRVLVFVLASDRGQWDHAVPMSYGPYAARLRSLLEWAEVGLHPSYHSSEQEGRSAREAGALQAVLGGPIRLSRQHFLRMRLPGTYRELERMGISEEHSMGFHEQLGFRAGTCTPYQWYDLGEERATDLTVHPFAVMDNTLFNKLSLSPQAALLQVGQLIARVKAVNGTFTGLWHESFLAQDSAGSKRRETIIRIMELARP